MYALAVVWYVRCVILVLCPLRYVKEINWYYLWGAFMKKPFECLIMSKIHTYWFEHLGTLPPNDTYLPHTRNSLQIQSICLPYAEKPIEKS